MGEGKTRHTCRSVSYAIESTFALAKCEINAEGVQEHCWQIVKLVIVFDRENLFDKGLFRRVFQPLF